MIELNYMVADRSLCLSYISNEHIFIFIQGKNGFQMAEVVYSACYPSFSLFLLILYFFLPCFILQLLTFTKCITWAPFLTVFKLDSTNEKHFKISKSKRREVRVSLPHSSSCFVVVPLTVAFILCDYSSSPLPLSSNE